MPRDDGMVREGPRVPPISLLVHETATVAVEMIIEIRICRYETAARNLNCPASHEEFAGIWVPVVFFLIFPRVNVRLIAEEQ